MYKQAIILRKDLKMSPGKAIAQGAHVAVLTAVEMYDYDKKIYDAWIEEGHKKIALRVDSEEELLKIEEEASLDNIACERVRDFGLTELEPNTLTAIAIGPDTDERIDKITKGLKLY